MYRSYSFPKVTRTSLGLDCVKKTPPKVLEIKSLDYDSRSLGSRNKSLDSREPISLQPLSSEYCQDPMRTGKVLEVNIIDVVWVVE